MVLAFEDLHWADPTTLDVLRGIAERGALAPLFIVATTRPEFRPPWGMRSHHGTISLAPLDRAQVRDMVAELSARHALPRDVVEDVAARTGGVPLFVEEVTRLLLERGEQGRHPGDPADAATIADGAARPARPGARGGADRLRDRARLLLRASSRTWPAWRTRRCKRRWKSSPTPTLCWSRACRRKAIIVSSTRSSRMRPTKICSRAGARCCTAASRKFCATASPHTAAAEPEALAHHFTQAGMTDAAIEWWGKAGDQALRRSAFQEAISHLGKAIEMADSADENAARDRNRFSRPEV